MEITLEKIELVKDRTGVTYKEAKEALERNDGNVVDAIVDLENRIDGQTSTEKLSGQMTSVLDEAKKIVMDGNVARIRVKKSGNLLLNLPLNVGILGAVIAPWGIVAGVLAAAGFGCTIELVKTDGTVVSLNDRAGDVMDEVKERGAVIGDAVKEKSAVFTEAVRDQAGQAANKMKNFRGKADDELDDWLEDKITPADTDDEYEDLDSFFGEDGEAGPKKEEAADAAEALKEAAEAAETADAADGEPEDK